MKQLTTTELVWAMVGWYIVLLGVAFGLGLPVVIVRRFLGKKTNYWPDTGDVLIGMGLLFVCFVLWGPLSLRAVP
jgi:hypothetical protein